MSASRPAPAPRTPLTAIERQRLVRKWRSWMKRIMNETGDLLVRQELFRGMRDVVNENEDTKDPGILVDWMMRNYAEAVSVGIRRLCDVGRVKKKIDVVSLGRLLFELSHHPRLVTRAMHRRLYRKEQHLADPTFDDIVGRGRQFAPTIMFRSDLQKLRLVSSRIHRFVDKRIAHATPPRTLRKNPTYGQISASLDVIDRLACKYNGLLTSTFFSTAKPVLVEDWKRPLRIAWMPLHAGG